MTPGENYESARDLCMFLIKEISKVFAYLQIVMREYYTVSRIRDFLYSEVSAYFIEYAIAEHNLNKMTQNGNSEDYNDLKNVIHE